MVKTVSVEIIANAEITAHVKKIVNAVKIVIATVMKIANAVKIVIATVMKKIAVVKKDVAAINNVILRWL